MLLALLLACPPAKVPVPGESAAESWPAPGETGEGEGEGESAPPVEEVPGSEEPEEEGPPYACDEIYDEDVVQAIEIEISDEDWSALLRDYSRGEKNYHPVVFRWEDEVVDDAMIRLKGNPSFSWFTEKMQFVIAFNQNDEAGRFHGMRKLSLDASWYEPTFLRDRVAWSMLRRQGLLPAACANSATLTINGELYGLYTNIEYLDHEWLERVFGDADATGTLWKYGYDAVSNEDAATGDVDRLWSTTDVDTLETLGDLDEWQLEWAAEIVLGDDDGYWCCNHNYYLYEHPTRGILWLPWDLDDAFDVQTYDVDPHHGYYDSLFRQDHFMALVRDPDWGPRFLDNLELMNEALDPALMVADIDAWSAQIAEHVELDPTRSVGWEEHLGAVERMRAWVPQRHQFIRSWIACQRGETTDADGDGHAVCEDPNDQDASVYPDAPETCNGVDDDVDGIIDEIEGCDDCARHDLESSHLLFCRTPRTQSEAEENCEARGGSLGSYSTTGEYYMYFFYTWPVFESWWTGSPSGGGRCPTWEVPSWGSGVADCDEEHPSVCRLD